MKLQKVTTFDQDAFLVSLATTKPRLCFYPSCGRDLLWAAMELDAEIFVLSDNGPRTPSSRQMFWHDVECDFRRNGIDLQPHSATRDVRVFQSNGKWAFLFFADNNDTLRRIVRAGHQLSSFVGIRDGCSEGGNFECVHNDPFLSKVLEAATDVLSYFTDHSSVLTEHERSARRGHTSFSQYFRHDSGWMFSLLALLVSRKGHSGPLQAEDLEVFFPALGETASTTAHGKTGTLHSVLLGKLAPFRTCHHESLIAHYEVRRVTAAASGG